MADGQAGRVLTSCKSPRPPSRTTQRHRLIRFARVVFSEVPRTILACRGMVEAGGIPWQAVSVYAGSMFMVVLEATSVRYAIPTVVRPRSNSGARRLRCRGSSTQDARGACYVRGVPSHPRPGIVAECGDDTVERRQEVVRQRAVCRR